MTDKPEAATDATAPSFKSMLDTATQIWLAGLGAIWLNPFFKAQDEGAKMLDLLVKLDDVELVVAHFATLCACKAHWFTSRLVPNAVP